MTATFRQPERTFIIHARIRLPTPGIKMQNETESLKLQHEALNSDTFAFFNNYDMTWRNNLLKVPKLPNPLRQCHKKCSCTLLTSNWCLNTIIINTQCASATKIACLGNAANSNARIINFDKTISPKAIIVQLRSADIRLSRRCASKLKHREESFLRNAENCSLRTSKIYFQGTT